MLFTLLAETRISKMISNMVALRSCEEGLLRYQYHYDDIYFESLDQILSQQNV